MKETESGGLLDQTGLALGLILDADSGCKRE